MSNRNAALIASDPDFVKGEGTFGFPNGDLYTGEYCAHRSGVVWREGFGQYFTQDGEIYKGDWKNDKLIETEPVEVTFVDGSQFIGTIVKNKYNGPGVYCFPHSIILSCEFRNNKPTGKITLIDFKGKEWHGMALPNQDDAVLMPENIYFNNINQDAGKGRRKYEPQPKPPKKRLSDALERTRSFTNAKKYMRGKNITPGMRSGTTLSYKRSLTSVERVTNRSGSIQRQSDQFKQSHIEEQLAKEQQRIFGKTKKTASDLKLGESDWYKNYTNFKAHYDDIKNRIDSVGEGGLNEKEKVWYNKYLQFKKRYCEIMNQRQNKNKDMPQEKIFELLDHEKFRASCPPVSVIYATDHCASFPESPVLAD